ncbi:MAG: NAD(P)/FAD-dependent oxidoreductase [Desulfobulbaceae bacterium]|uniref:NAD(P)/FAD-dependent oxidoreductase n=1 Tax=Candidatus Desulfobia pelagia TaxID=2841692 RepID=A0A8J6TAF2_9BACT|nr:NAD(P)/FAD-dependent oxidoreductase [Candidatus Desulfobia pelagia]
MSSEPTANHKTYAIIPDTQMGMVSIDSLEKISRVARKHNIPLIKITSAQRLAFCGFHQDSSEKIWQDMGLDTVPKKPAGVHYVQACPGIKWCKYGCQDSLALGARIKDTFMDISLPAKTKIGVSGCSMNCCESYVRDVGVFGKKTGWTVIFGGNGGGLPRIGDIIAEGLTDDQALEHIERCLGYYKENARKRERTARFMERTPLETFKESLGF